MPKGRFDRYAVEVIKALAGIAVGPNVVRLLQAPEVSRYGFLGVADISGGVAVGFGSDSGRHTAG